MTWWQSFEAFAGKKKIGHTGTLDPDAVGVLPVCLGNATKLCDMLTDRQKEYIATLQLGISTDTQDGSGKVLARREVSASPSEVRDVILSFVGDSMQVPPMYSALKVNGKKLYELAREGKEVERAARPITIYELEILEEAHPEYIIKVKCSKGTYIRTLCHDIGEKLGCGGVMVKLIRSKAGGFEIETARTLDQLQYLSDQGTLSEAVIPVEKMFEAYPAFSVKESAFKAIQNGNQLKRNDFVEETADMIDGQKMRVYSHQNIFYGVYQCDRKRELFLPVKMFFS